MRPNGWKLAGAIPVLVLGAFAAYSAPPAPPGERGHEGGSAPARGSTTVDEGRAASHALAAAQAATRYVRYDHDGRIAFGILQGETIRELSGNPLDDPSPTGRTVALADVRLLVPVDPARASKVIGVAINTRRPNREEPVPHPRWFAKFPTSLNGPDGGVELPPEAGNLNYEGELVVIIGREGRHIPETEALDYVFGYSVGNDFSENTWYGERQGVNEPTRLISKGTDTWAVMGPAVVTGIDYRGRRLRTWLNGELVQDGSTDDLVNGVPNLISNISRYVTLLPGDVIYTGTVLFLPDVRRRMQVGDVLEVEIEGIGRVRSRIVPMQAGVSMDGRP